MTHCYKSVEQLIISQKQNKSYNELKSIVDLWLIDNLKSNKINQTTAKTLSDLILNVYINSELDYTHNLSQLYNQLLNAEAKPKSINSHVIDKVANLLNSNMINKLIESIPDKSELLDYIDNFKNTAMKLALKEYVNALILPDVVNPLSDDQIDKIYQNFINDDLDVDKIRKIVKSNIYDKSKLDSISQLINGQMNTVNLADVENLTDSIKHKIIVNKNDLQADAIIQSIANPVANYNDLESNFKITELKAKLATEKSRLLDLEDQLNSNEITQEDFDTQSKILLNNIKSLQESIKDAYTQLQDLVKIAAKLTDDKILKLSNIAANLMLNQPNDPVSDISDYLQAIAEINSKLSELAQIKDYLSTINPATSVDDIIKNIKNLAMKLLNFEISGYLESKLKEKITQVQKNKNNDFQIKSYKFIQKFCDLYDINHTMAFENKIKIQVLNVDVFNKVKMSHQKAADIIVKSIKLGNKNPKDYTADQIKAGISELESIFKIEISKFNVDKLDKSASELIDQLISNLISKDAAKLLNTITPTKLQLDFDTIIKSDSVTNSIINSLKHNPKFSNLNLDSIKKNFSEILILNIVADFIKQQGNVSFTISQLIQFAKLKYPKLAPALDSYFRTFHFDYNQPVDINYILEKLSDSSEIAKNILSLIVTLTSSKKINLQKILSAIQINTTSEVSITNLINQISEKSNEFIKNESLESETKYSFDEAMKRAKESIQTQFTASNLNVDLSKIPDSFLNIDGTDQQIYAIKDIPPLSKSVVKADGQIGILVNKKLITTDVQKGDTTQNVIDKLQATYFDKFETSDPLFAIVDNTLLIKSQFSFKNPMLNIIKSSDATQIFILDMPTRSGLVKLDDALNYTVIVDDLPIKLVDQTLIKLSDIIETPATIKLNILGQVFEKAYDDFVTKDQIAKDIEHEYDVFSMNDNSSSSSGSTGNTDQNRDNNSYALIGIQLNSNNDVVILNTTTNQISAEGTGFESDIDVVQLPPKSALTTNPPTKTESSEPLDTDQTLSADSNLTVELNGTPITVTVEDDTNIVDAFEQVNAKIAELGLDTTVTVDNNNNIVVESNDGVVDVQVNSDDPDVEIPEIPEPKPKKQEHQPEATKPGKPPTPDNPKPKHRHHSFGEVVSHALKDAGDAVTHVIDSVSFTDIKMPPTTKVNKETGEVEIETPIPWLNNTVNDIFAIPKVQHAIRDYFNIEDKLLNPPNIPPIDMKLLYTKDGIFEDIQYEALLLDSGVIDAMTPPAGYTDDLDILTGLQMINLDPASFKQAMADEINKKLPSGWHYKDGVFAFNKTFDLSNLPIAKKLQKLMDMNLNDIAQKYLDAYLTKYTMMMYTKMLKMMKQFLSALKPVFSLLGRLAALMDALMPGSTNKGINFCNLGGFSWPGLSISISVLLPIMNFHWPTLDLDALWKAFLKAVLMALSNLKEIIKSALRMVLRTLTLLLKMAKSIIVKAYKAIVKSLGMDSCFVINTVIQLIKIIKVCVKIMKELRAFQKAVRHPG